MMAYGPIPIYIFLVFSLIFSIMLIIISVLYNTVQK